jgi:hypothetical protein
MTSMSRGIGSLIFFLLHSVSVHAVFLEDLHLSSVEDGDIPSSSNRIDSHWYVVAGDETCQKLAFDVHRSFNNQFREFGIATGDAVEEIFGTSAGDGTCSMVCIEKGSLASHIQHQLPERSLHMQGDEIDDQERIIKWYREECLVVDIGFVSHHKNPLDIYWVPPDKKREPAKVGTLQRGEKGTQWHSGSMGHVFELKDPKKGNKVIGRITAMYSGVHPIGGNGGTNVQKDANYTNDIARTFRAEYGRSQNVKRTFTELGFDKGRLPPDLWNSMSTYYYNNRNNQIREPWGDVKGGHFVNWWERDAFLIPMPW